MDSRILELFTVTNFLATTRENIDKYIFSIINTLQLKKNLKKNTKSTLKKKKKKYLFAFRKTEGFFCFLYLVIFFYPPGTWVEASSFLLYYSCLELDAKFLPNKAKKF